MVTKMLNDGKYVAIAIMDLEPDGEKNIYTA